MGVLLVRGRRKAIKQSTDLSHGVSRAVRRAGNRRPHPGTESGNAESVTTVGNGIVLSAQERIGGVECARFPRVFRPD